MNNKKLNPSTIRVYNSSVRRFINWINDNQFELKEIKYDHIIRFVSFLQSESISVQTINKYLIAIRYFYESLNIKSNPAKDLVIRGTPNTISKNILSERQLEGMYDTYQPYYQLSKKDKIILGLIIYQGISRGDLIALTIENIDVNKGEVTINQRVATNKRVLSLKSNQMIDLHSYMTTGYNQSQWIFCSNSNGGGLNHTLQQLCNSLRDQFEHFQSLRHLRNSVITNWLNHYNLREVQYMAGHRYVSSTEKYKRTDISQLQSQLNNFDPFKD